MGRLPHQLAWIACAGAVRRAHHGTIHCPIHGRVTVARCLSCPRLMATDVERDPLTDCSTRLEPRAHHRARR